MRVARQHAVRIGRREKRQRSRQAVRSRSVGGHDGHHRSRLHAHTGPRIDDVRIVIPVDLDELLAVAGRRDGGIDERDLART